MKRCPKCNREFDDDMHFCLDDGHALVNGEPSQTTATAVLPTPGDLLPTMTAVRPEVPTLRPPLPSTQYSPAAPGSKSGSGPAIIIVIALVVVLFLSLLGVGLTGLVFASLTPMMVLCLVGMIVAMLRAKKHPKVSMMAGLGLAFFLFKSFVYASVTYYFPRVMHVSSSGVRLFYLVAAELNSIVYSVVIALLVAAALAGREPRSAVNS